MTGSADIVRSSEPETRRHAVALGLLLVLTLAMFAEVLFTNQSVILDNCDIARAVADSNI